MTVYDFIKIEAKWQKYWSENQVFKVNNYSNLPKYYVMDMFPYPSGAGLHVGHPLGYIASDIYSRYKRHKGFNVLHPQGYDSFGLPAEQYAIQTGRHPLETTNENILRYRTQLDRLGFSFDWSREIRTSNKDYYKWTQWMFIKLYNSWFDFDLNKARSIEELILIFQKNGNTNLNASKSEPLEEFNSNQWNDFSELKKEKLLLKYRMAFLSEIDVNWCPKLGTVLANDEIIDGLSERGGYEVIRKKMTQWSIRISAYSNRLLSGLEDIDWPDPLKEMQRNWIGKSEGALVKFDILNFDKKIEAFTTRADTIYGVTFVTLAPEHSLVELITLEENKDLVKNYILESSKKTERERLSDVKIITGVFTGAYALHPLTNNKIPIWISDYVLAGYGTGAVMAVPCGDQRDYNFAKFFNLPIVNIFKDIDISNEAFKEKDGFILTNSEELNGLDFKKGFDLAIEKLEKINKGIHNVNYKLRDAVFSRQRYWGEPFPVYYKDSMPVMISEKYLPIELPDVDKYLPTEDGKPPLGNSSDWAWDTLKNNIVSNKFIDNETVFRMELNTMPGWAGSSWYFNRYMDPNNENEFASKKSLDYWKEVDLYIGGSEHATGHLLYSRFWQYFLYDLNLVPVKDYAKKLINQGMILGNSAFIYRLNGTNTYISKELVNEQNVQLIHIDVRYVNFSNELDLEELKKWQSHFKNAKFEFKNNKFFVHREVEKMSKSKYNVVSPDEICNKYGADTLRLYEMFLGPIEQAKPWNTAGITGTFSFLKKFWSLFHQNEKFNVSNEKPSNESLKILHKTIKKINEDIENFSFNTSVSAFMICVNGLNAIKCNNRLVLESLCVLLSPFAPHICEEIWSKLGYNESISFVNYPEFNSDYIKEDTIEYPVSFNGKLKFKLIQETSLGIEQIKQNILRDQRTNKYLDDRDIKKIIVVPKKIINIVC
ncbi:MAG: leucine--tRNA ligase [Flavobacteriaceae bacterium]|jgi:leucyl-tRNA synthetase|nr:leucine--tRNA ligase [Flavobacteriaceae bacterium]MBT3753742.1 leucine--tRNA ligase [Flavobacteriaceae bacterium]MBT4416144.1 leucine--tRNA ligase [Flavobacteriaceae bacterium]MBT5595747.1 leucine--tRNA ligase [Flavobacteriaceae bacterium]MBT5857228.1 leucine--tRNA ligase [Flavobacteriaceae bacterium]